jgi:hypothetical protein
VSLYGMLGKPVHLLALTSLKVSRSALPICGVVVPFLECFNLFSLSLDSQICGIFPPGFLSHRLLPPPPGFLVCSLLTFPACPAGTVPVLVL